MDEVDVAETRVVLHDWSESGMSWSSLPDRGLDTSKLEVTTVQEWEKWRDHDTRYRGYPLPTYDMLIGLGRPDVVKRWFLQLPAFYDPGRAFNTTAGWVHWYAVTGFTEGVIYEIDNCESQGHSREELIEIFALAFMHAVAAKGMWDLHDIVPKRLERYQPETQIRYPDGWGPDPEFLKAGLDYSDMDMLPGEVEKIEDWYREVCGEVPEWVGFLAKLRPNLLKAYRHRFENTVRVMPKQMMPWIWLQFETLRGHEAGIREAVLLCKGFGVSKETAMNAVAWGMLYGGHGAMSTVSRASQDIWDTDW
jgi:hypothetical protein